jgi:hypothetical protein
MEFRGRSLGDPCYVFHPVARRPVQAALGALCWAAVGCAGEPAPTKPEAAPKPSYGLDRPALELAEPTARDDAFRRGVTLGLSGSALDEEQRKPVYARLLDDLVGAGVSDLELVVEWSQTDVKAIEITPHPVRTVDDDFLRWLLDESSNRKLRVCLTPVLDVDQAGLFAGRSVLAPEDWDRWWWSYQRFVVHYARMAEGHQAALFSIGSELTTTESQPDRWRALTKTLRKVYEGPIAYTAHVSGLERAQLWDIVDVVALTGHDTFEGVAPSSDAELDRHYRELARRIGTWAERTQRRYVLSDAHQAARVLALSGKLEPAGSPALLAQLRTTRALYKAFHGQPRLEGLFASSWLEPGRLEPAGGQGRAPAAEVLRHFYAKSRSAVVTAAPPVAP